MTTTRLPLWKEPYRPFFLLAMAAGALGLLLWGARLAGWMAAPMSALDHGLLMGPGVLGGAVLGFLLTAYPKQNEYPALSTRALKLAVGAWSLQLLGLLMTPWLPQARSVAIGVGSVLWLVVWGWSLRVALPSLRRKWDPTTAAVPVVVGAGLAGLLVMASQAHPALGRTLVIHGFVLPLAVMLLDRLLPFFSSKRVAGYTGRRAPGMLPLLGLGVVLRVVGAAVPALLAPGSLLMGAACAWAMVNWRADQGLRVPLVGVLHLGMAWLVVGLLWEGAGGLQGAPPPAALHAITVGGLATLVAGISVRVTRGHAGHPLILGRSGTLVIGLIQVAAVVRVAGEAALLPVAALTLAAAFVGWLVGLGPKALGPNVSG
jgi:uncharacterized protein involved in response to NO